MSPQNKAISVLLRYIIFKKLIILFIFSKFFAYKADIFDMKVFEINNYKTIIRHYMELKGGKALSRKLAEFVGIHPSFVSQVLTGNKDFSEEQIYPVCEFLGIPNLESQYVWVLLQIERAGSQKLKNHYQKIRDQISKEATNLEKHIQHRQELSETDRTRFYSTWMYSAMHIMTTLDKTVRFDDITQKFDLSQEQIRDMLDFLISCHLVVEDNGVFKNGKSLTHLSKNSPHVIKHHTNWRLKAIQASETLTENELMYSVNFSISKKDFKEIRAEMLTMIQGLLKKIEPSPAEDIAQFNLDLFWIKK